MFPARCSRRFDEEDEGSRPAPLPTKAAAVKEIEVAEQPQWDSDVEEIFVRGRPKLVKKRDTAVPPPALNPPPPTPALQLGADFLEEDEHMPSELEGKYDDDGDEEQAREEESVDEEDADEDTRQQLKEALALSMTFAVNRDEEAHPDVSLEQPDEERRRLIFKPRPKERERALLDTIAEEEDDMKAELQAQQREDDTDVVVIVHRPEQRAVRTPSKETDRTVITLVSEAVRMEECGDERGARVTMTVDAQTSVQRPLSIPPDAVAEETSSAPSELSAPSTTEVRPPTTSSPPSVPAAAAPARSGFVLPSLASLASSSAAKSTNLFFEEKQRQQEAEEKRAQSDGSSPPSTKATTDPSLSSPSQPPSPTVSSLPPPSSSSSPVVPEAGATWSSHVPSSDAGRDEALAAAYSDASVVSSSLARQKAKQAKQQQQVTQQMLDECRHLLTLFGCPYIISPAEAEAQCATLELLGLVDGVVTEDSDVFLFGARHVYRNIFEQKKYAERYRVEEVDAALGLDRAGLISLALLLGSDYTEGVHGVGIVNAMEIVNAFPGSGNEGLREFQQWVYSGSEEKRPLLPDLLDPVDGESAEQAAERERLNAERVAAYRKRLFKYKHRNIRSSWHVSRDFPSDAVRAGYERPNVDRSEERLSWSRPRWDDILAFLRDKFKEEEQERRRDGRAERDEEEWIDIVKTLRVAWEEEEARAAVNPHYQAQLDRYFRMDDQFAEVKSRRINSAIAGLTRQRDEVDRERERDEQERVKKKRKPRKPRQKAAEALSAEDKENDTASATNSPKSAQSSPASVRGRGRGRGRARGRATGTAANEARSKEKEQEASEDAVMVVGDDVVLLRDATENAAAEKDDDARRRANDPGGRARGAGRGRGGRGRGAEVKRGRVM